MPTFSGKRVRMKTSDHFIGVPAASLPGMRVLAIPGAGFQALGRKYVSKSNHLSRPLLICPCCSQKSAIRGADEHPEPSRVTWSGDGGALRCDVGCTQFWKWRIGSGSFLWPLLLFLGIVFRRMVSARCFFASLHLKSTEGDRQLALSRCKVAGAVLCGGVLRCGVCLMWHRVACL